MNLLAIRTNLVKLSGRFDLVEDRDDYKDNGADFFIQSGQRLLDTLLESPKDSAEFEVQLKAGDYKIPLSEVRAVKEVWAKASDEGIHPVAKNTLSQLRETYGLEEEFADVDQGFPSDWALGIRRREIGNRARETGSIMFVMPPAEKAVTLLIEALYLSPQLSHDDDVSWWSVNYPDLLIQAALYKAEIFLRNTQGARDWLEAIQMAVTLIDHDQVEQAIAQVDQMKNSWNFRTDLPKRTDDYGTIPR